MGKGGNKTIAVLLSTEQEDLTGCGSDEFDRAYNLLAVGFATAANARSDALLAHYGLLSPAATVWDRQPILEQLRRSLVGEALFLWRLTRKLPTGDLFPITHLPEPAGSWLLPGDDRVGTAKLLTALAEHWGDPTDHLLASRCLAFALGYGGQLTTGSTSPWAQAIAAYQSELPVNRADYVLRLAWQHLHAQQQPVQQKG